VGNYPCDSSWYVKYALLWDFWRERARSLLEIPHDSASASPWATALVGTSLPLII
jgi:hypothetical protein